MNDTDLALTCFGIQFAVGFLVLFRVWRSIGLWMRRATDNARTCRVREPQSRRLAGTCVRGREGNNEDEAEAQDDQEDEDKK